MFSAEYCGFSSLAWSGTRRARGKPVSCLVGISDNGPTVTQIAQQVARNSGHHDCLLRVRADYSERTRGNLIQEQVQRLRRQQLPIDDWRNWVELPHVISPGEFNLQSSASSVVTKATNLNIADRLAFDVQWFNAMDTIATHFQH